MLTESNFRNFISQIITNNLEKLPIKIVSIEDRQYSLTHLLFFKLSSLLFFIGIPSNFFTFTNNMIWESY